jgi:HSP20 family protein
MAKRELGEKRPEAKEVAVTQKSGGYPMNPVQEMERVFDRLLEEFGPRWLRPLRWNWPGFELPAPFEGRWPRVDVVDRESEVLVRAELPGVTREELEVSMTDTAVTIRAATRREEKEEHGDYHRSEIQRGEFLRTVPLPAEVDEAGVKARFADGLLELTLPKRESARRRVIKVE